MKQPLKAPGFGAQWALLGVMLLIIGGGMLFAQWRAGQEIGREETARLHTQVRVADQVLIAQLQSVDAGLKTLMEGLDRWRLGAGYVPYAMEHLKRVEHMIPAARTFVVLDANGLCQLSNRTELVGQHFQERNYFKEALALPASQALYVSPPYRTVLGVWAVTVSRPVRNDRGHPVGVVAATLSPEYFQELVGRLGYAPDMRVSLVHTAGALYTTSPPNTDLTQINFLKPDALTRQHLDSGKDYSVFQGPTPVGTARLTVVHTVNLAEFGSAHHFVAIAGRDVDAIYAIWRRDNGLLGLVFAMVALGAMVSLVLYQRWVRLLQIQRREARQAMERSHARYEQLAGSLPCVLFDYELDANGQSQHRYVSPYAARLTGLSAEQLMADPNALAQLVHPDDLQQFNAQHRQALETTQPCNCTFRLVHPNQHTVWVQMSATPTPLQTDHGKRVLWSGFMFDVSDRVRMESELRELAFHDPLTNAHNRRSFMALLQNEFDRVRRTGQAAAVLMVDIDHFKRVNDTWGHDAGDVVLKELVRTLGQELRRIDVLGRLGGEEFAVLLPATHTQGAMEVAERLRAQVASNPVAWPAAQPDGHIAITISLGLAVLEPSTSDPHAALKAADNALYEAKHTGRNRVVVA